MINNKQPLPPKTILSIKEVCSHLGVCRSTLYELERKGILIPGRLNTRVFYDMAKVKDFIFNTEKI